MKKVLQKSLSRLHALLLLTVMFVVGGSAAWAQDWQVVTENSLTAKSGFTIIDANGDGTTWQVSNGSYIQYSWNSSNAANDYCVLDGEELIAGATYRVSFDVKRSSYTEKFKIVCGTSASASQLTTVLLDTTIPTTSFATYSGTFTAPAAGTYYFAIQAVSDANQFYLYANNYKFEVDANTLPDDGSVKSTLNFDSWNLSYSGGSSKPISSTHFNNGEVFSNAEGVTMTLTNIPDPQAWPNECFYSNPAGSTMALYLCNGEGFTIAAPSGYNLSKIVVNRASTSYSMTSLIIDGVQNNDGSKGTWTGEAESVEFSTISGDASKRILISNIQVTLTPVEEGDITYTIDLVNAPDGAYVTLDEQRFEADGTYTVEKSFGKNDLTVYEPAGYYAEVEYTRDSHTYTVTYYAYNYYDVTVTGTTDPAAGVVYNEQTYGNGTRIETKDVLTQSSVEPVDVAGYNVELTLANGEFRVAYTEKPVQGVPWEVNVASIFSECTVVDNNSDSKTWTNNGEDIYYPYHGSNYANDYIILPAVRLEAGKTYRVGVECHQMFSYSEKLEVLYGTSNNVAGMTNIAMPVKNVTWNDYAEVKNDFSVAADGVYYFAIHAVSNPDLYNLYVKTFSIKEPEPRQCVMDVASTFFSTGNVEQISSGLTFVTDVNTEGEHSGNNGSSNEVPAGVILEDGNGTSYTISSMLWWDNDSQVMLNLASAITAPGHYTLTIPEGVIPCVGNKANKEIVFEWTIAAPTTYTVTFADGAPAGASVTIDGNAYTESTTFQSRNNLDENSANVKEVEGYEGSVAYDSENKEFTITYTALPTYDYFVTIYPTDDTDLKIRIDGKEYGDSGMDFYTFYKELTEGDIVLPEYPGYYPNPSIRIDNTLYMIEVEYTPLPSLAIGSSATDREGNYWTSFCLNEPVEFGAGVTPCIVTGANNGVLTVEEIVAEDNEYSYDLDFTTGAYSGNSFTAMDGKLTVEGVNWVFNTVYGYAETANTEDWTTVTFTLADDFNGEIKSIRLLTANDTNTAWFSMDGGITWLNNVTDIPVHGKTITLGAWYDQAIKHFYLDIVEPGDAPVFPANTAVLLKSDAPGAVTYYTRPAGNVDVSTNILSASGETGFNVSNDADHLYYKLTLNAESEAGSAGFYWGVEGGHSISVPAHKAYLVLDAAAASNFRAFTFGGDDTITAIEGINAEADNAPVYNLQGQRVNVAKAGVYVKNGRKVIVK